MLVFKVFLFLLSLTGQFPDLVYMNNGNAFHLGDDFRMMATGLRFRDEGGTLLSIQYRQIDFARTFAPPEKPPPQKPVYRPRTEIPWDHPHYADKMAGFHAIEITTKNLRSWSASVPKPAMRIVEDGVVTSKQPGSKPKPTQDHEPGPEAVKNKKVKGAAKKKAKKDSPPKDDRSRPNKKRRGRRATPDTPATNNGGNH